MFLIKAVVVGNPAHWHDRLAVEGLMQAGELERIVDSSKCRVLGWEDAGNSSHRKVLAALIRGFDDKSATILCEPSLARTSVRAPDIVVVDPTAGIHVVEVKGLPLAEIGAILPGGMLQFRYDNGSKPKNPVAQVRNAMFEIKNATEKGFDGEIVLPFKYWVVFPNIVRSDWFARWGNDCFCPPEFLFVDDIAELPGRMRSTGLKQLANSGLKTWPEDQVACVWKAFGDSSVLYHRPEDRESRRVPEGTLGEAFDEAAELYKTLSEEQQSLSVQNWREGPRLVRGVAGSGKTIVLANNLARRLQRISETSSLFDEQSEERILVVCNNRSLVPFLEKKIGLAFQQRTGRSLPKDVLQVTSFNRLLWSLSRQDLWKYQHFQDAPDAIRSANYLKAILEVKQSRPDTLNACQFDAIYVDEGQDFQEDDFRILVELCRVEPGHEPNLYIFYDDAQNLFARTRPNWLSVGLNVRGGRAHVMSECFRNTSRIVEAGFNVLYGTAADHGADLPTKEFGDVAGLEEKKLIERRGDFIRVRFARREGLAPRMSIAESPAAEIQQIVIRLRWLIEEQRVRPQDILILSMSKRRVEQIHAAVQGANIKEVGETHVAFNEQDKLLGSRSTLTLSTTASAKGYDAYCVLLASANEFNTDIRGRTNFYVGCTRAIEYLEVFRYCNSGLAMEWERVLNRQQQMTD